MSTHGRVTNRRFPDREVTVAGVTAREVTARGSAPLVDRGPVEQSGRIDAHPIAGLAPSAPRRRLLGSVAALGAASLAGPFASRKAAAQGYPDRPVRVIQPFAAGNTLDVALRQVAEPFTRATGQPLLIDNKPGGAGFIAAQACAQAAPDGYSLLHANTSMLAINPHTFGKLPYDPVKSFRPITMVLGTTMVFAAGPATTATSLAEWIAWVKANPGKSNFASFTAGNSSHFSGVLLNQRAGLDMVHVPHNGSPPAVQNLLGGQVQTAFLPLLAVKPHVESGKVRVLAVTSGKRSPLLPDAPTFVELGYPDLEVYIWSSLMAPAATPDPVIERLNTEIGRILSSADIRDRWRAMDFEPLPMSPSDTAAYIANDSRRWAEAVKLSGFKAD